VAKPHDLFEATAAQSQEARAPQPVQQVLHHNPQQ
jgi:hypothetical protein